MEAVLNSSLYDYSRSGFLQYRVLFVSLSLPVVHKTACAVPVPILLQGHGVTSEQ
jgi:hypothetical protein